MTEAKGKPKMKVLSRSDILNADDTKIEPCDVPEWGGVVLVKGLTGYERDQFEASILKQRKDGQFVPTLDNVRSKLVVKATVDEDGKALFSEGDIFDLGQKSAAALQRVWAKARELSGLSDEDVESLVGNSNADQSEGSTSS